MFKQGFFKTAAGMFSAFGQKVVGPHGGQKPFYRPLKITNDVRPGNPVNGLKSITGQPEQAVFGNPVKNFGTRGHPRPLKGLKSVRTHG